MQLDPLAGFPVQVEIPWRGARWTPSGTSTMQVGARISETGVDGFLMCYVVVSQRRERVAAEGSGRIVSFDYENKCKAPLQPVLRERLARLESGA